MGSAVLVNASICAAGGVIRSLLFSMCFCSHIDVLSERGADAYVIPSYCRAKLLEDLTYFLCWDSGAGPELIHPIFNPLLT